MELTKRKAVELTMEHWQELANTGSPSKADALRKLGYDPDEVDCSCWCCAYDEQVMAAIREEGEEVYSCHFCPLTGYAWEQGSCLQKGSIYYEWGRIDSIDFSKEAIEKRKTYAQDMVSACEKALFDLDKEEQQNG